MGDTRLTNLAFGKYANFSSNSANVFAESDTTPDVTNGVLFFSNNTTSTVITNFDLTGMGAGSQAQQFEGKVIEVVFLDNSTGLASNSRLITAGSGSLQGANNSIRMIYHNSAWIEFSRSVNVSDVLTVTSASLTGAGQIDARGRKVVITTATAGSANVVRTAINGEQGQRLVIYNGGSAMSIVVNSAATNTFVSTSSTGAGLMVAVGSVALTFTRIGNVWVEERPAGLALNAF